MKPIDNKPVFGLLNRSFIVVIINDRDSELGNTSAINVNNSSCIFLATGKYGIKVKIKIAAAGMAIIKLKATAEALSLMPILFIWLKKNFITSYKHKP